jgi:STE24 endopeptidase
MSEDLILKAKRYSNIKYGLAITDTLFFLSVLALFQSSGLSLGLAAALNRAFAGYYLAVAVYLLLAFAAYSVLDFPLNLYRSFIVEHRFNLCNQKIKGWLVDYLKTMVLSFVIFIILAEAFYYILNRFTSNWWIAASLFWIFFSVVLAKLTPVLIIPLFFKYKPFSDAALRQRIIALAEKMKIKILDVFEIDFSKKTLKANAAFLGMGRTKRVILADTLKDKYGYDEIEVILAHEFAHYRLKHLLKLLLVNSMGIILSFYIIFQTSGYVLGAFGIGYLTNVAALPVILIYITLLGIAMTPLENYISRRFERQADSMALQFTGLKESFISMMDKLADQNLAERRPARLIKIFFFDHPPIDERIGIAKGRN